MVETGQSSASCTCDGLLCGRMQDADAEEEAGGEGGRRRAREARRDVRQAERHMLDARMRKREVRHASRVPPCSNGHPQES